MSDGATYEDTNDPPQIVWSTADSWHHVVSTRKPSQRLVNCVIWCGCQSRSSFLRAEDH
jgi:hypothetical protein